MEKCQPNKFVKITTTSNGISYVNVSHIYRLRCNDDGTTTVMITNHDTLLTMESAESIIEKHLINEN